MHYPSLTGPDHPTPVARHPALAVLTAIALGRKPQAHDVLTCWRQRSASTLTYPGWERVSGTYRIELIRATAGWLINNVVMTCDWEEGNRSIMLEAATPAGIAGNP